MYKAPTEPNINQILSGASGKVDFVYFISMEGNITEVKSRTLTGIMDEIGGFAFKAKKVEQIISGRNISTKYRSALYEFIIDVFLV